MVTRSALESYYSAILRVLLTRLQNSQTEAFVLRFVRFYHFFSAKVESGLGADLFVGFAGRVQEKYVDHRLCSALLSLSSVFVPVYLNIILPETQKLLRPLDRKTAVISLTKTLADSAAFAERYKKGWAFTCEALLKLLENPPEPTTSEDAITEQDPDDMSFGVGFTQLTTIKRPTQDRWPEITDVKKWVGEYMRAANARQNGKISTFAQERLSSEAKAVFGTYVN